MISHDMWFDKQLNELAHPPAHWLSDFGVGPANPDIVESVRRFLQEWPYEPPQIVPMTGGRIQLEWNSANGKSLELEFQTANEIHYLKWDSEEWVINVLDWSTIHGLMAWFKGDVP